MWSKPLNHCVLEGQVDDIDWLLDTYLDYNNQIEVSNLTVWVDGIPQTLENVFTHKRNTLYDQLTKLMLDPALRDILITDIMSSMNRQGIIPGPILRY